jgi:hypothetical protein
MNFQLSDHCQGTSIIESIYLPEITIIVHCDHIVSAFELKQVYPNLLPGSAGQLMGQQCFFALTRLKLATNVT